MSSDKVYVSEDKDVRNFHQTGILILTRFYCVEMDEQNSSISICNMIYSSLNSYSVPVKP